MEETEQNVVALRDEGRAAEPKPVEAKASGSGEKAPRTRPRKYLPSERIAWSRWFDLLRAYAVAAEPGDKPVTNEEAAEILKMKASTVALANPFLVENGFLTKTGAGYIPAPEVLNYKRAYEWNPESAGPKLAPLVQQTWFGKELLRRLAIQPLDEEEAVQVLAEAAAATVEYRNQVRALVDWAVAVGVIARNDGQIVKVQPTREEDVVEPERPAPSLQETREAPTKQPAIATTYGKDAEGVVHFNVNVRVVMSEFAGWRADRIAAFFNGIAAVLAAKSGIEQEGATEDS